MKYASGFSFCKYDIMYLYTYIIYMDESSIFGFFMAG